MKKLAIIGSITCVVGAIIFISAFASKSDRSHVVL